MLARCEGEAAGEALLCARIPPLEPEAKETFPPEPLLLAAGIDPDEGTAARESREAGRLSVLRARAVRRGRRGRRRARVAGGARAAHVCRGPGALAASRRGRGRGG